MKFVSSPWRKILWVFSVKLLPACTCMDMVFLLLLNFFFFLVCVFLLSSCYEEPLVGSAELWQGSCTHAEVYKAQVACWQINCDGSLRAGYIKHDEGVGEEWGSLWFAHPSSDPLSFARAKFVKEIKHKTKYLTWQESTVEFFSHLPSSGTSILNWLGHWNGLIELVKYLKFQLGHRAVSIDTFRQPSQDQSAPAKLPLVWLTKKFAGCLFKMPM